MCNICKELLTTRACSLGKTANSAVHQFDPALDVQETDSVAATPDCDEDDSSDEDEDSDDSDSESYPTDGEPDETKNARTVLNLITQVNAWHSLEGPKS